MSAENGSPPGFSGWKRLTPNSPWFVDLNVESPVPSLDPSLVDPDNPATIQHPGYNSTTGEQKEFPASEIIEANLQYREDHSLTAKPRPMTGVW